MSINGSDTESFKDSIMTKESVVSKVSELMEPLVHVKKYNELSRTLKNFVLIVLCSITLCLFFATLVEFYKTTLRSGNLP